jgi:hypothetical protein
MPRSGGTFALVSGNPVESGSVASSTVMNNTLDDIADELTNSIARDGQSPASANLPMGGYRHTNVGTASARNHYAAVSQVQDGSFTLVGSVAGTDTITGQLTPAITAYAAPLQIVFLPAATNTGAVTFALNGLAAKAIVKNSTAALEAGDLEVGIPALLTYDGTRFFLLNPAITAPEYRITAAEIAAGVTPVNYAIPSHDAAGEVIINRYGNNTSPGATDMSAAITAALAVANQTAGTVRGLGEVYLTGEIDWPGNNISLIGSGSAYSYNTSAAPKTTFRAKAATTIILDLVQTGVAEDRTGNYIADIDFDGNSIAAVGVDMAGTNIIERCRGRRCTEAGLRLSNFTNSTRVINCGWNSNSGWGLKVDGVSTTTFSIDGCTISLNTLGGMNFEAGNVVGVTNTVSESNTGPGLRIYRPTAHTNAFGHFEFVNCHIEDNGSAAPLYSIVIDSESVGDTSKDPEHIVFRNCRISAAISTRKYFNINACKDVIFDSCKFAGSTQTDALTGSSTARFVALLECATGLISGGLTETQIDNFIAQGTRCYSSDRDVKRAVGAASPAAAFANSWANEGGSYPAAKYWFDVQGNVHLEGTIDDGTIGLAAFTLPVGYRPPAAYTFAVDSNDLYGMCNVGSDGVVTPAVGSSTRFSLNGICFPTG